MSKSLFLTGYGGVGEVTGSNFLLSGEHGNLLVDCGLFQGRKFCEDRNEEEFPYDPASIGALLLTHAHMDHLGRVPRLVRAGFRGKIYSTPETRDLAPLMFADALAIMRYDSPREILYDEEDIERTFSLWETRGYHERVEVPGGLSFIFKNAGHILGSAMVEFSYGGGKFLATGDLGNSPSLLLPDTESSKGADYILMESVYGDRNHPPKETRDLLFKRALQEVLGRGGTVTIPAFSLERTQDILYLLNGLVERGEIGQVPVFLDSPLSIGVTKVFKKYLPSFKESVREEIHSGDDIFNFPKLKLSKSGHDSLRILEHRGPKIILAGSGMSSGGRITKHEKEFLPDSKSGVILVGYQAVGTLGRDIEGGAKRVIIGGEEIGVRASIYSISGFSAHKDMDHLVDFVFEAKETLRRVFVTMGEPRASMFLAQRLHDYLEVDALVPKPTLQYELKF